MAKGNVSSIRYSDEVAEVINQQPGETFSDRFHHLVLYCFESLPELEEREKKLKQAIEAKKKELQDLTNKVIYFNELASELQRFKTLVKSLNDELGK